MTVLTDDEGISKALYLQGAYQYNLARGVLAFLRKEGRLPPKGTGTVVDAGAHIGEISIGMILDGEFGKAIAIEPAPRSFALLKRNVQQNGLSGKFTIHDCALAEEDTEDEMELCWGSAGDNRIRRDTNAPERNKESQRPVIEVSSRTIDGLVNPSDVALVWMDIQGFEGQAFKGGSVLFSHDIPVNVEVWPYGIKRSGMGLDEFVNIVESNWTTFCDDYVKYSISEFRDFVDELDDEIRFKDIILL